MRTRYFRVWAETSLPVYSDGTVDNDADCANDNIRRYFVDEYEEDGTITDTVEYDYEEFGKIAEDHPAPEWQNHEW